MQCRLACALLSALACSPPGPSATSATPGDIVAARADATATADSDQALDSALAATPTGVPLADLAQAWLDAACNPGACLQNGLSAGFLDPAVCKAFLGDAETADLAQRIAKAKAGQLRYDPVQAAACVAAQAKLCRFALVPAAPPAACSAMFTGAGEAGSACTYDDDCASDWCDRSAAKADHCPGVCGVRGAVGAACKQPASCQAGLACVGDACQVDTPVAMGGTCGEVACAAGLWCDAGGAKPVCKALIAIGKPCQDGASCVAGATCFFAEDGPSLCQPLAGKGEPCSGYDPIVGPGGGCGAGLVCANLDPAGRVPNNRCLPLVPLGKQCEQQAQCGAKDLVCKGASPGQAGVCAPVPKVGEACTKAPRCCGSGLGCFPGAACDPDAGHCVPAPGKGEACVAGVCTGQWSCVDGKCDGPSAVGEACSALAPCAAGLGCLSGQCTPVACQ